MGVRGGLEVIHHLVLLSASPDQRDWFCLYSEMNLTVYPRCSDVSLLYQESTSACFLSSFLERSHHQAHSIPAAFLASISVELTGA